MTVVPSSMENPWGWPLDICPSQNACWMCATKWWNENRPDQFLSMMFLCETCGNKRCPHATSHTHPCTGSNEKNQPGSNYCFVETTDEQRDRAWEEAFGITLTELIERGNRDAGNGL